jgi:hypothetical protein
MQQSVICCAVPGSYTNSAAVLCKVNHLIGIVHRNTMQLRNIPAFLQHIT